MKLIDCVRVRAVLAPLLGALLFGAPLAAQTGSPAAAQHPGLPSETPARFEAATDSFDYVKRDVMIPMRDGVKLHTVILVPKGAQGAPILLTRTPYDATVLTSHAQSAHLGPILTGYDNATEVIVEGGRRSITPPTPTTPSTGW
jgi:predicted acyl esterase